MPDEWYSTLPDTLTVEHNGAALPVREHPFVKEAPDLPTFVKRAYDAHREVGARVPVRISKPEEAEAWRKEHLPKLYQAGILQAPPASPDEYGIAKPDDLPEGVTWNDELAKSFATTLHKHGVPKAAAADLMALHRQALAGQAATFTTSYDEGLAALKTEHGDQFEARQASAKRLAASIFQTPEELAVFEASGLGNHPKFLSVLMRLAPLAESDSSFIRDMSRPGGGMDADAVRAEVQRIATDKTHPMYEGYRRADPKVMAHIDGLYKKAYGDEKVQIGGIVTEGRPA